jgi:hypothetical protein
MRRRLEAQEQPYANARRFAGVAAGALAEFPPAWGERVQPGSVEAAIRPSDVFQT